ncbi:MAG: type II toxin-antitoxin system HicA family toxin [Chloroflexi bacterium]|nr:type II toxin-antitoxin system HicA family toxin [Chloroflexota bacterium]MYE38874.1 type II toxin-antitoxin system HicA family toxin [Chloroflexota bacterium]
MTYRQLTRKLRALGCRFDRQARGSHEIWLNPANQAKTTIPFWGSDDLKPGVIVAILRDLGISRRHFDQA